MTDFHSRHLPHIHALDHPIFITWRLHGSLPSGRPFLDNRPSGRAFVAMDRLLDRAVTGPTHLRRPEIADMVVDAIRFRDPAEYELHCFVVMPNHVHMLVTPHVAISKTMHSLQRFTAREANRILGWTGQTFWQEESYDRLVRDEREFEKIAAYIENNPVTAGLVKDPAAFPWSSLWPIANRPAG